MKPTKVCISHGAWVRQHSQRNPQRLSWSSLEKRTETATKRRRELIIKPFEKFFNSCSRVKNVKRGWAVIGVPVPEDTPSTDFEGNNILALARCEKSVYE